MLNTVFLIVSSLATDFTIVVGNGVLNFSPASITAMENDTVSFTFSNTNHNVIQADALGSCTPLTSGFQFPATGLAVANDVANFTVGATPSYFYCNPHCASGMKFNIMIASNASVTTNMTTTATSAATSMTPTSTGKPNSAQGSGISYVALGLALMLSL